MKLVRLRVAELRQFRLPFELRNLQPGLNLFTGANEAGKSTLVRAIRAAFFERHRSTSVDDLCPYGDSAATPAVELDFEIAGTPYRLVKSFLQKKRCELQIGTRRLEGVDAEDHLAELLGFQFAGKGASREEHWGIPGLLWIEQGSAQAVHSAVEHAVVHLRSALNESLGEMAASGGDEVLTRVRDMRSELLTGTGRPRAAYQQAIEEAATLQEQVSESLAAVQTYRDQVDQLRQLRDAHVADASEQPWKQLREQQAQAEAALQAIDGLDRQRAAERESLRRTTGLRELLLQQLTAAQQQQKDLAARDLALDAAAERHELAEALEQQGVVVEAATNERLRLAREALALARQEHNRTLLNRQLEDARARASDAAALLERSSAEHERVAGLKREAVNLHIEPKDLKKLRLQQERLRELEIRQAAVATRIGFELDAGRSVVLGTETVSGQGERLLVEPSTLTIAGVGRLQIAPGGSDLAELAREHSELKGEHATLLQRLGIASLIDAETRDQAHRQKAADASAAEKALALLAPKGMDALRAELDGAQARMTEATAALAKLPAAPETAAPTLATAELEHDNSRMATDAAIAQLQEARQDLAAAASRRDAARQERDSLKAALDGPQRQAQLAAKGQEMIDANAQEAALKITIESLDARIAAARPEILKQDVERLRRSAEESERQHHARDRQIAQLEAALAAAGAQGLEEELSSRQGLLAQAERRREELQRRAAALDHLLERLESHRQALTLRLQAPLQTHIDRYLQLLFPEGHLEVDENLTPGALTRPGARGPEAGDFETLSFGAREQMGVISRLAYADLLKDAGRPTLIILDDALVHSDEQRLSQMKRVLFDAAQRHQVMLFTCHPGNWRDLGVVMRSLETERSAALST